MKLLKQLLIAGLLIYVCVQIVVILPRHLKKEKVQEAAKPTTEKKSEQILTGVHLVESQKGGRDWELLADKGINDSHSGNWNLQKVTVHFYNKETKEFTVTGDEGSLDAKTKDISVKGNVNIQSFNGYVFKTDDVFYKSHTRTIETESAIKVIGPNDKQGEGMTMDGLGLVAEVDTSKMTIKNNVKAHKSMNDHKDIDIQSNSALLNGRKKEVYFRGNVNVGYDSMRIQSPISTFKYSENLLEEIIFDEGVQALQTDRKATSQQLIVRLKEQKLIFKGNPVLTEKDDELRGDQITLLDGGRKVKVEKVNPILPKKDAPAPPKKGN